MTVYVITQAWEGDILGIYLSKDTADRACADINARPGERPATVEDHEVRDWLDQPSPTLTLVGVYRPKDHGEQ